MVAHEFVEFWAPDSASIGHMTVHIVTMGGGGFSMSAQGAATNLDRYLVELTGKN